MTSSSWRVPLSDLPLDPDVTAAVVAAVESGWWSMGPRVGEIEEAFGGLTGSRHALAVSNGTAALHLALLAVGCGPGDEVVLPSLNFVAAANVVVHVGATPVFCDIRGEGDLNLDAGDLAEAITPATKAIIALHYGGFACDIDAVLRLARERGLAVIEDAAHAPGATLRGKGLGTFGDIGCFSFFSNKNMPVGEGGMVVTDDDDLAGRLRLLRSHGMTTLTWERHRGHASSYDVVRHGFNYRLDEIRAAMGLVQLRRLVEENAARRRRAEEVASALESVPELEFPLRAGDDEVPSQHLLVALLQQGLDRDAIRAELAEQRIQTSVHYPPIHQFTAFREFDRRPLPQTDAIAARLLTLPLFGRMSDEQVDVLVEQLRSSVARPTHVD